MNRRALSLLLLTLLSAWACPVVAAPIDAPRAARLKGALGEIKAPAATVRFIDVDQGDATLISIDGKHVLIDSGPPKAADGLVRDLRAWGVTQIDLLINTHAHADHIGGAAKLIEAIPVKAALDPGVIHPSSAYKKMLKALEDHQIPVRQARAGREIKIGSARLKILAPKDPLFTGTRSDHNANSVVTRLDVGGVRFLFMGDAEAETEERLISDGEDIKALVLKVAHHGSGYATHEPFIGAVTPRVGVISCGISNNYGHPNPGTIARLESHGVAVFQTQLDGTTTIQTDGVKIAIQIEPKAIDPKSQWQIDPNIATAEALERLPTVGVKLAAKIVAHRQAHGPFKSVEALGAVPGVSAKRLGRMAPHLKIGAGGEMEGMEGVASATPRADGRLNLNTASLEQLKGLPGIGEKTAAQIIAARPLSGPSDVLRIKGIGEKKWAKIAPKVSFE